MKVKEFFNTLGTLVIPAATGYLVSRAAKTQTTNRLIPNIAAAGTMLGTYFLQNFIVAKYFNNTTDQELPEDQVTGLPEEEVVPPLKSEDSSNVVPLAPQDVPNNAIDINPADAFGSSGTV